jgi:UDP-N-acetylmuramoyl-tripeptide--D-alanyl-D-alanine ligase
MMTIREASGVLLARVRGEDATFTGVSTDTRTIRPGDLFVALRGERFDGHAFLEQAHAAGAAAAMVDSHRERLSELPTLVVGNTRVALGTLAAHWRERFSVPLVAITGSSGKTTVKEMLAAVLRAATGPSQSAGETFIATRGNLNNDIGVPLMLLELRETHRYAVLEMGMNHAREIAYLTKLARPDVALITNAGRAHIEYLGSEDAIANAKGEIFEGLGDDGIAVINADDRYAQKWRDLAGARRKIEFGLAPSADVTARHRQHGLESEIALKTPDGKAAFRLRAPGVHNVRNALAAAAAAVALNIPVATIAAGLETYTGIKGRLQATSAAGATIIDDTYNANPESMRAAIAVLAHSAGRKLLVVGDMGELGARAPELHRELGALAKQAGIDRVLAFGEHSAATAKAFGSGATHYARIEDLVAEVKSALSPGLTVLVKGSRFMKMERVVAALAADGETQCS